MSSEYTIAPIDLSGLSTVSLKVRGGKVRQRDFASAYKPGSGVAGLLESLPRILAGDSFRDVVEAIAAARSKGKPVVWGMGGHVIKCGLAPVLIDLMHRGFATAFAMNGSASIHDFEIALVGSTSEDVEAVLPDGRFGSAEETGLEWNRASRLVWAPGRLWARHCRRSLPNNMHPPVCWCRHGSRGYPLRFTLPSVRIRRTRIRR